MVQWNRILIVLLTYTWRIASGDDGDGLCGIEPPKVPGGKCSGSKSEDKKPSKQGDDVYEKLVFDDYPENETEIWQRRFYTKNSYTCDYDWNIRDLLDTAEDFIVDEPEKSIRMLDDLLKKYPDSPRAAYNRIRAFQFKHIKNNQNQSPSQDVIAAQSAEVVNMFFDLMKRLHPEDFKFDPNDSESLVKRTVYNSAFFQALSECENANLTSIHFEILESILSTENGESRFERHQVVLVEKYFVEEMWDQMRVAIQRALKLSPNNNVLKFLHGILLKRDGNKKEGNKLLHEIDFSPESAIQFADEMEQVGRALYNRGKYKQALSLFQEVSKAHVFLSSYQRPVLANPDLEANLIWKLDEHVSITKYDEEIQSLEDNFAEFKSEVEAAARNFTDGWKAHTKILHDLNLVFGQGNWSTLPLYSWGSRRHYSCSKVPKTCFFVKEKIQTAATFQLGVVKFDAVMGNTRVLPIVGPTNARLRAVLPISNPDEAKFSYRIGRNTQVPFKEGKVVIIDDSFEHEIRNDGDQPVIWLSVDLPHPDIPVGEEKRTSLSAYAKGYFLTY